MPNPKPATLTTLAAAVGGTADLDNAVVRFPSRHHFIRCAFTGKVQVIVPVPNSALAASPIPLGTMSEGVDTLAGRYASLAFGVGS